MPTSPLDELLDDLGQASEPRDVARLAEQALEHVSREDNPTLWASLQGALASALVGAAGGRYTSDLFTRVLGAYEAALTVYTPEEAPEIWGQTWRNVGATYVGAVESRLGDPQPLVEAAISAYRTALGLPFERHNPQIWLTAQRELGWALGVAAAWRGPSAHLESAQAYAAALEHVSRETSPGPWAMLQLLRGSALNESGAMDVTEEAIEACENALHVLTIETRPSDWAEAHLILGGCYRTRRTGRRDDNLERAVASLDRALEVFTRDRTPAQWFRGHYQRGPAYVFRVHGDRRANLEHALESLQIAIAGTPREDAPEAWASLLVTLGQAYMERIEGDHADNVEVAIGALEPALVVLPPRSAPAWAIGQRWLGLAYLERRRGDRDDNVERAIAALDAVKGPREPADDPGMWTGAHANLGEAYLRRARGDAAENRARAREAFEAAASEPPEHWGDPADWLAGLRRLALLDLEVPLSLAGVEQSERPTPPMLTTPSDAPGSFDLARQAREQAAALQASLESGEEPRVDPEWHVPQLLNEEAGLLRHRFEQFLSGTDVTQRTPDQRSTLELERWTLIMMVLEHLHEKYAAARRTQALFEEVARGGQRFVLFLRGFAYRARYYSGVTVVHGGGPSLEETIQKRRLAQQLAPVPLVLIGNPVESGPLEQVAGQPGDTATIFRVESGAAWESDVRALIAASSFIVMHNPVTTPGVLTELRLLEQLGRLGDTFCHSAGAANDALERKDGCRPLDDEAVEHMRRSAAARPLEGVTLPAATILWMGGPRRARLEHEVKGLGRWVERLALHRRPLSADLELDATAYLIATLALLEDLDLLPGMLLARSRTLGALNEQQLRQAKTLAERHAEVGERLRHAWAHASAEATPVARIAAALQAVGTG